MNASTREAQLVELLQTGLVPVTEFLDDKASEALYRISRRLPLHSCLADAPRAGAYLHYFLPEALLVDGVFIKRKASVQRVRFSKHPPEPPRVSPRSKCTPPEPEVVALLAGQGEHRPVPKVRVHKKKGPRR